MVLSVRKFARYMNIYLVLTRKKKKKKEKDIEKIADRSKEARYLPRTSFSLAFQRINDE